MITTPEEEQVTLDQVRNQITLSEGELLRLQKLRASEEYSVAELVKEKKFHQDELDRLKTEGVVAEGAIDDIKKAHEVAQATITQADTVASDQQTEWDKLETAKHTHKKQVTDKQTELDRQGEALEAKQNTHANRVSQLNERQKVLEVREAKLKAFISELKD